MLGCGSIAGPVHPRLLHRHRGARVVGVADPFPDALLDLASHQFDLVRWLLDDEIASVTAEIASDASEDDIARVELRTATGVTVAGFVGALHGQPRLLPSLADGLRSLEAVVAAEDSARAGATVPLR